MVGAGAGGTCECAGAGGYEDPLCLPLASAVNLEPLRTEARNFPAAAFTARGDVRFNNPFNPTYIQNMITAT